jgi:predicted nucleic acid-binding protein
MYLLSSKIAAHYGIDTNDGLAIAMMKKHNIKEIYSFDKHFDKVDNIIRVTK